MRAFGEHSVRITGARHVAYSGREARIVRLFARWESEVTPWYINDTPLTRLADPYKADGSASSPTLSPLPVHVVGFSEEQIQAAGVIVCAAQASADALTARVEAFVREQLNRCVPVLPTFVWSRGGVGYAHVELCLST